MWLIAGYESVTLFSLRMSSATASGGKTLLVPTPYAIKMALVDTSCRNFGVVETEKRWPEIRDLSVGIIPAQKALVTNLFQKILKPYKKPPSHDSPDYDGPFQRTISYREYVQMEGTLFIALGGFKRENCQFLDNLLLNISYLGKRGGFMQITKLPLFQDNLPEEFVITTKDQKDFKIGGTLQVLDDCSPSLSFEKANIYSDEKIQKGRDRIARNIVLPYHLVRSSKSYSLYERFE